MHYVIAGCVESDGAVERCYDVGGEPEFWTLYAYTPMCSALADFTCAADAIEVWAVLGGVELTRSVRCELASLVLEHKFLYLPAAKLPTVTIDEPPQTPFLHKEWDHYFKELTCP